MSALSVPHGQETPSRLVPPSYLEQGPPAQTATTSRAVRWSYRTIRSFFERIALHHLKKYLLLNAPRRIPWTDIGYAVPL